MRFIILDAKDDLFFMGVACVDIRLSVSKARSLESRCINAKLGDICQLRWWSADGLVRAPAPLEMESVLPVQQNEPTKREPLQQVPVQNT